MPDARSDARLVLTTFATPEEAARLGRTLVHERLAACATLVPGAQSIFQWKGVVEESIETLMLIKTEAGHVDALEKRLHELHSYETPEFLVLEVDSGSGRYLDWLHACLQQPRQ
jgi:periplasmic divalent cation tolerance protein